MLLFEGKWSHYHCSFHLFLASTCKLHIKFVSFHCNIDLCGGNLHNLQQFIFYQKKLNKMDTTSS